MDANGIGCGRATASVPSDRLPSTEAYDPVNVLIVEDHARTREAVLGWLNGTADIDARGAGSADAALRECEAPDWKPDVALVDLGLGADSGLEVIAELSRKHIACLAFTVADDAESVHAALACGAVGYLLKDDAPPVVAQALRECGDGRRPISSGVTRHLLAPAAVLPVPDADVGLTAREREVLIALARGLTYAETAAALGCRVGTVQSHVKHIYAKLDVNSKTEACAWAWSIGLVH